MRKKEEEIMHIPTKTDYLYLLPEKIVFCTSWETEKELSQKEQKKKKKKTILCCRKKKCYKNVYLHARNPWTNSKKNPLCHTIQWKPKEWVRARERKGEKRKMFQFKIYEWKKNWRKEFFCENSESDFVSFFFFSFVSHYIIVSHVFFFFPFIFCEPRPGQSTCKKRICGGSSLF